MGDKMKYKKMEIESFEVIEVDESNLNIIKLNNVMLFSPPDNIDVKDPISIKGKTFLSLFHYHYHHFVIDTVAQYEYIKKYVPDLNIEFMIRESSHDWSNGMPLGNNPDLFKKYLKNKHFSTTRDVVDVGVEQHKYFEGIFDMYNIGSDKLVYSEYNDQIIFEEVYFLVDDFEFFSIDALKEVGLTEKQIPWLSDEWIRSSGSTLFESWGKMQWEKAGVAAASLFIKPMLVKDNASPKKIYISRKLANKRYLEEKKRMDSGYVDLNIESRVFNEEDTIESFFIKNGYTPVILEGMSFLDQMNLFYNATHVAGLSGSGFINMIACQTSAKILEIRALKSFHYWYNDYGVALGLNHTTIDLRGHEELNLDIMECLERYAHEV